MNDTQRTTKYPKKKEFLMKKFLVIGIICAVAVVAVLAFGAVGYVYAQTQTPAPGTGYGHGMMGGGRGMMGNGTYGPLHEYMINELAKGLGLTAEEMQTRIENGETPYQIAQSLGLTDEQISALFLQAHDDALAQAVADGVITQEQADWMDEHMEQRWEDGVPGFGPGTGCPGMGGGRQGGGRGPGWRQP
jgi:hypothetical protein